jgi:ribose transport system substrate-binding protein
MKSTKGTAMKHKSIIVLAGVVTLALSACTTTAVSGSTSPSSDSAVVNGNTVSLVLGVSGSPFYEAMACGAKAEATKLGLKLDVTAASQFAADAQLPILNAVTASRPSVAAVVPTDSQALQQPLASLVHGGTKLITVDQTLSDAAIVKSAIVTDNIAGGELAAEQINSLIGGKGKVLVVTQPPGSSGQDQRVEGFEKKIKTYSGITYIGPQYASDDPQKVAQIVTASLAAHPDLSAIFATNDQGAIGAVTGLSQAHKSGSVKLVAYDAATSEVDALKNGTIQALIAQNPTAEGQVAMQTAKLLINGKTVKKSIVTELVVIKAGENAKADKYEYKAGC